MEKENSQIQDIKKSKEVGYFVTKIVFLTLLVIAIIHDFSGHIIYLPILCFIVYPIFLISLIGYWKIIKKCPIPQWFKQLAKFNGRYNETSPSRSFATDPRFSSCVTNVFHRNR